MSNNNQNNYNRFIQEQKTLEIEKELIDVITQEKFKNFAEFASYVIRNYQDPSYLRVVEEKGDFFDLVLDPFWRDDEEAEEESLSEDTEMIREMLSFISKNHIFSFAQFVDYCQKNRLDWLSYLVMYSDTVVVSYIDSLRWEEETGYKRKNLYITG